MLVQKIGSTAHLSTGFSAPKRFKPQPKKERAGKGGVGGGGGKSREDWMQHILQLDSKLVDMQSRLDDGDSKIFSFYTNTFFFFFPS